ncbi:hypothetical protein PV10_02911 [Exophiala mesophila]|uniref:Uncharacterized protein n=1 Tax=Exophiala mesophila TaxID=212818 RepID=A0A0D1ZMM6_EXOME|nr:uncharacterized protein PV10_02911 [Exophiala mesophila]KIV95234.1 hypothetical protein PV10_02911 [Exophiala mesophila]
MTKQPAVIIIARHGARLDQADRNWVLDAQKPYDPPLSYSGWMQCQTLGVRINNELHNLDSAAGRGRSTSQKGDTSPEDDPPPPKKRKIIIHSSPFTRCIQTSVAIAAGIQHPQNHTGPRYRSRPRSSRSALSPTEQPDPISQTPEPEPNSLRRTSSKDRQSTNRLGYNTCLLRIDAFLGEWLSPGYFENGPQPPPSAVLTSEAKFMLQEPQEEIKGADLSQSFSSDMSSVDGEEKENAPSSTSTQEKTGLRAMAAAGHSFPKRARNISFGTELANGARILNRALRQAVGYTPPMPNYAIAASANIPPGFVAHARDGCIQLDKDWDSQNEPLNWGDGGPFGEEWSSMHRRFRTGFQKMVDYYENLGSSDSADAGEDDIVLVLVTHQAGCNALIRLLTGAPALHDIGTASLTLAVRQPNVEASAKTAVSPTRRRGSLDCGFADDYDVKIIASTDHLRAPSNPLGLNSPRLGISPALASRRVVGADSPEGLSLGEPLTSRGSSGPSLTRSLSQRASIAEGMPLPANPTGLWRRGSRYSRDESPDPSDSGATNSARSGTTSESIPEEHGGGAVSDKSKLNNQLLPVRSASQRGLWGGEAITRDRSPGKRRWTAVERSP